MPDFWRTGREDIAVVVKELSTRGIAMRKNRALDFGCGIGRLTQAMAELFENVVGVDIAPTMIAEAERLNRFPGKCTYVVSANEDLRQFQSGSFDFILSRMVLQHLPRRLAESYLDEFLRVLAPGGILAVQIPSRRTRQRFRYLISGLFPALSSLVRTITGKPPRVPMRVIPRQDVERLVAARGAKVLAVVPDEASGPNFESLVYYVMRPA